MGKGGYAESTSESNKVGRAPACFLTQSFHRDGPHYLLHINALFQLHVQVIDASKQFHSSMIQQSVAWCLSYAVASGCLRVAATMVLAYPEYLENQKRNNRPQTVNETMMQEERESESKSDQFNRTCNMDDDKDVGSNDNKAMAASASSSISMMDEAEQERDVTNQGTTMSTSTSSSQYPRQYLFLALHLVLLLLCAILSVMGTLHGPVSVAIPVQVATGLLVNVVAMVGLRMREFDKAQRTGTYVVFLSVLSLVDVGPKVTEDQDAAVLFATWPATVCVLVVSVVMAWAALWMVHNESASKTVVTSQHGRFDSFWVLLLGMTASNVAMGTSGKAMGTLRGVALVTAVLYYIVAAALGVLFSVVSSKTAEQGVFTPASSVALLVSNMLVGLLVWQDYKSMDGTWIAYACTACLQCAGVYLLAEVDLVEMFWRESVAKQVNMMPTVAAEVVSSADGLMSTIVTAAAGITRSSITSTPGIHQVLLLQPQHLGGSNNSNASACNHDGWEEDSWRNIAHTIQSDTCAMI